jgi:hypothetical protein
MKPATITYTNDQTLPLAIGQLGFPSQRGEIL